MPRESRIVKRGNGDFHQVYRPCRISEVYGQDEIKQVIRKCLDEDILPHGMLFHGISGTGKTSLARIVAMGLNCEKGPTSEPCCECYSCKATRNGSSISLIERNSVDYSGVEHIRKLRTDFAVYPFLNDRKKVYLFDESHGLSVVAQNALLKSVEDAWDHVHFIFCSTDPDKMIETLRNRCMEFEFKKVRDEYIQELLMDVVFQEGYLPAGVLDDIIKQAEGRPRNALNELQKTIVAGKLKKMPFRLSAEEPMRNTQDAFEQIRRNAEIESIKMTKER